MPNFTDILGALVQSGMSQTGKKRLGNALGGQSGSGSLDDILGNLSQMMGGSSATQAGSGSGLGDMLGSVMGSLTSNKAALGGLGALAGSLLGGGKSSAKGAIGGGSLAMLGALAFSALKKAGQKPATPQALVGAETPQQKQVLEHEAAVIVKAMINAAKADGQIDKEEVQKILGKLDDDGLSQEEKEFFTAEAARPLDLQGVINSAAGNAELAAQIYAASLLAIEVDTEAERQYMQQLADGLKLPAQSVDFIEMTMGMAR